MVENDPNAPAGAQLAMGDQEDRHGNGRKLRQHALDLRRKARDLLDHGADTEPGPDVVPGDDAVLAGEREAALRQRQAQGVERQTKAVGPLEAVVFVFAGRRTASFAGVSSRSSYPTRFLDKMNRGDPCQANFCKNQKISDF